MNTKRLTTWIGSVAIAGMLVGTGAVAALPHGAEASENSRQHHRWQGAPGPRGPGGPRAFGWIFRQLDLTEEQRNTIHETFASEREAQRDVRQRLFEARRLLREAALREEPESVLDQLAQAVGRAEAEAAFAEARRFAGIVAILEPAQKTKLEELQAEAEARRAERQERFREGLRRREER